MIVPDVNLLVYAYDETCPLHGKARDWWEAALSGTEPVGIPWVVVLGFTRILTHPQISANPLAVAEVRGIVTEWMDLPHLRVIQLSNQALDLFFDMLEAAEMGGNLSTDALIALHAREHSATIHSNDRDFDRFPGIKWINPLQ
ncbi:MAG: TA system VapC family ribonuclease toxin [Opitutales bacterium]